MKPIYDDIVRGARLLGEMAKEARDMNNYDDILTDGFKNYLVQNGWTPPMTSDNFLSQAYSYMERQINEAIKSSFAVSPFTWECSSCRHGSYCKMVDRSSCKNWIGPLSHKIKFRRHGALAREGQDRRAKS